MRVLALVPILALLGCSDGGEAAADAMASAKAEELSAERNWSQYEKLSVGKVRGAWTYYINAVSGHAPGVETSEHWRITISSDCGAFTSECSHKMAIKQTEKQEAGTAVPAGN